MFFLADLLTSEAMVEAEAVLSNNAPLAGSSSPVTDFLVGTLMTMMLLLTLR